MPKTEGISMRYTLLLVTVFVASADARASAASAVRGGSAVTATLVNCGGTIDCWLAQQLVPRAWLDPSKAVVIERVTTDGRWTALPVATGQLGGNAMPPDAIALDLEHAKVSAGIAVVPLAIVTDKLAPDHYTGIVRVSGEDTATIEIPLDIHVRSGPSTALLWLLAGVLIGLLFKFWKERGQRLATNLNALDRWTAIIATDSAATRNVLAPLLLEAHELKLRGEIVQLEVLIARIEARRRMLRSLDQLDVVCPDKHDEIERIQSLIALGLDKRAKAAIATLEDLVGNGDTRYESFSERIAAPEASTAPVTQAAAFPRWTRWRLWLVQHVAGRVLRVVVIGGAVVLGLKALYLDGGATYGANAFFDGIALFVWGVGAEVSTRTFAELGKAFAKSSRTAEQLTPKGNEKEKQEPHKESGSGKDKDKGKQKSVSLPGDTVFKRRHGGPESGNGAMQWPHQQLQTDKLSKLGLDGEGVLIGVIDTGVSLRHPRLHHNRITVADIQDGGDGDDLNGHGTSMIGILASDRAINSKSRVLSIRALDSEGNGCTADLVKAIDLATRERCDVISISAGQPERDDELDQAIARARDEGVVVVSAIRKENPGGSAYPACCDGVLAVTPSKPDGHLRYPNPPTWVSVGAPGTDVPSYDLDDEVDVNGSSPATAVTSGICARLLGACSDSKRRELAMQLSDILRATGKDIDGGRLLQALAAAQQVKER